MVTIKPFKAIRPVKNMAHRVAALPYDVMSREEATEMIRGNRFSFLRIDRPETEFDSTVSFDDASVYKRASENFKRLMDSGVLKQDPKDFLYIYRLKTNSHSQAGLVACLAVDEYLEGVIKKHEHTRQDKELDRTRHVLECGAHTGPILLFHKKHYGIGKLIEEWMQAKPPVHDFLSEDGVVHSIWVIDNRETIERITGLFAGMDSLYIADGHHRCAAAANACLKKRQGGYTGHEEFNYFLGVVFPHSELKILDYNRVVYGLNGLSVENFIRRLSTGNGRGPLFEINPLKGEAAYRPSCRHIMGMYVRDCWYRLKPVPGTYEPGDPISALDVSILQKNLLEPVLGIKDPKTDARLEFVGGIRGIKELEKKVTDGASAAFSLYPTSIEELMAVADAGKVMPPKSTWFEPKLRSGLFIHALSE